MRSLLQREKNVPQSGPPLDCACLPASVCVGSQRRVLAYICVCLCVSEPCFISAFALLFTIFSFIFHIRTNIFPETPQTASLPLPRWQCIHGCVDGCLYE